MIRQITRNEAERLIAGQSVISTDIRHSPGNLSVKFTRSDKSALLVIYNLRKHKKTYFILSSGTLPHGSLQKLASAG
ncbi:hypothetical protein JXO52_17115 [bacterium]|nr:hypothetical protein [bacterium]